MAETRTTARGITVPIAAGALCRGPTPALVPRSVGRRLASRLAESGDLRELFDDVVPQLAQHIVAHSDRLVISRFARRAQKLMALQRAVERRPGCEQQQLEQARALERRLDELVWSGELDGLCGGVLRALHRRIRTTADLRVADLLADALVRQAISRPTPSTGGPHRA
jgi:hypothetical protein